MLIEQRLLYMNPIYIFDNIVLISFLNEIFSKQNCR